VSLVDLTEIRRLETARRDFVANASHELKTPLTSIRGYAETLQDETLPAEVRRRFLDTIRQNAERLQGVVDDLLDLSRIEAGAWEPDTQPIRVAEAARDAWAGLEEPARGREARLSLGDGTDVEVLADPFALRQILTNLLDNALRHTPDPAVIRVLARSEASSGRGPTHVRIEVVDDGAGIPSESVPRIFERFFRVDPARTGTSGGTGLGLAIVKHLVEHMGGQANARSELGRGTTVGFTLPMAAPVRSPSTKGAPSALVSSGGAS
jgi:two-component system phosphate regulon sensor histidine kinase PhoR